MNLIIFTKNDYCKRNEIKISDRRYEYIKEIHKPNIGDNLKVGLLNGDIGNGKVTIIEKSSIQMSVKLTKKPPISVPVNVVLALPRPKVFKRIIQSLTSIGVKNIFLINAFRVEKSYWQSPAISFENINKQVLLGLEQAVDTVMPEIIIKKYFKPFVEDELEIISNDTIKFVAHPGGSDNLIRKNDQKHTIVIGPEGGFIEYEIKKLKEIGFKVAGFGERVLKVETAIPYILSKFIG
ncbi:MAG: 16S rRNA (uracil(1498)-N(3))-methyltransferase [Desulfobacterales bacterium]|nr:16S rRNA (uracil(1498)-N(3))-methyltransferase [Desulfobacterales bacterium]